MKRVLLLAVMALISNICAAGSKVPESDRVVVAYVTSWSTVIPDPFCMTHINYAFGHVTDSFDGVRVDNPQRLNATQNLLFVNAFRWVVSQDPDGDPFDR